MLKIIKHKRFISQWLTFCILVSVILCTFLDAKEKDFIYFDTEDVGQPDRKVPLIQP